MFIRIFQHEIRNILRDKMYGFFMVFSLLMIVGGAYLIPYLQTTLPLGSPIPDIVTFVFIIMMSFFFGAITGFTMLDDKDDYVLFSLRVTPIDVKYYVIIKLVISYLFGFVATFVMIIFTPFLSNASFGQKLLIAILAALQGPILSLLVNAFSSNKVEGFVFMKMSGLILMLPIAAFFVEGPIEFIMAPIPGFWTARMVGMHLSFAPDGMLSFLLYFIFGVLVNLLLLTLLFRFFQKRNHL